MFYPDEELGINIEVNAESPSHNEDNSLTPCSPLTNGERSEVRYSYTGLPASCPGQNFPRDSFDVIIVKREKRCFTIYYTLLHIIRHYNAARIYILS